MYLADLLWTIPQNTNMQAFAMLQAAYAGRAGKVLPLEINSEVRACATYFKIRTQMQTQRGWETAGETRYSLNELMKICQVKQN